MTVDVIEKHFWQGLKLGVPVFASLAGEEFLTCPFRAYAEGERLPLWLLAPREAPFLRRLHRNDNGVATVILDEFGIFARVTGQFRLVEDDFSMQRVGRMVTLPWPPAALAESTLLRFDLVEARFWLAGCGEAVLARLDTPRKTVSTNAAVVSISSLPMKVS